MTHVQTCQSEGSDVGRRRQSCWVSDRRLFRTSCTSSPRPNKYTTFQIPKRNGGQRTIKAPVDALKLLQRKLSDLLQDCVDEVNIANKRKDRTANGFKRKRSIVTNARQHRHRRWVFNLDLEDFFPSINFGRVRGFLLKNRDFELCTWRERGRSTDQGFERVSTRTAVDRPRSHDQDGEGTRAATVEAGGGLPAASSGRERLLPVQIDHWGWPSSPHSRRASGRGTPRVQPPESDRPGQARVVRHRSVKRLSSGSGRANSDSCTNAVCVRDLVSRR